MTDEQGPPFADVKREIRLLAADLREAAALRWQLARLELRAAVAGIKRLSTVLVLCGVMALSGLPILAVAAAWSLDDWQGISFGHWLLIFGLVLLAGGTAGGLLAWRCFRRRFRGLEETAEELREDLVWLGEWLGVGDGGPSRRRP